MTDKHSDSLFWLYTIHLNWPLSLRDMSTDKLTACTTVNTVGSINSTWDRCVSKKHRGICWPEHSKSVKTGKKKKHEVGSCPPIPVVRLRVLCRKLVGVAPPRGKERKSYVPETLGLACWEEGLLFQGVKLLATEPGVSMHCSAKCSRFGTCE